MTTDVLFRVLTLTIPLVLQLLGLLLVTFYDPYVKQEHKRIMHLIIFVAFGQIVQNLIGYQLDVGINRPFARTVVGIVGYTIRPVIIVLFCYIVSDRHKFRNAWILIVANTAIYATALFSHIVFWIDEENVFHRGALGYTCHIISAVLLAYLLYLTIRERGDGTVSGLLLPVFNVIIIAFFTYLDTRVDYRLLPVTFLTISVVSSCVFYYIWLHLQFARVQEQAMLAESRIRIMMSQIQPHFLYNTLSTIQALCTIDPKRAADVTEHFGMYLRKNLESLKETKLVPIDRELEHTRTYADIEAVRFPNIRVIYDIQDREVQVPALTVQPLVENAIRHGLRSKKHGCVTVTTHRTDAHHEITVLDDGNGFDVATIEQADGTHIGIRNVRERVEKMCRGTLVVHSRKGEGTLVIIRIPQGGGGGQHRKNLA